MPSARGTGPSCPAGLTSTYTVCIKRREVPTNEYRRALDAAVKEYERLSAERQRLDTRLSELAQSIGTLSRLCGLTPTVPWGLTDACRTVLRSVGRPMTPSQVRDRLTAIGFDLSIYANALAAIHTTLKRLAESGELAAADEAAKRSYVWQRPPQVASLALDNARIARAVETVENKVRRRRR